MPDDLQSMRTWNTSILVLVDYEVAVFSAITAFLRNEPNPVATTPLEDTGQVRFEIYTPEPPDEDLLRACLAEVGLPDLNIDIELLPDTDWVAQSLENLKPISVGRYYVHGAHDTDNVPRNAYPLCIDAGQAFGTGHHATTTGCLMALGALAKAQYYRRPLDLGCGTGILAMAMARTWHVPVCAADNDPLAVKIARENAQANGLQAFIHPVVSAGFAHRELRTAAPFDVIAANILARPLMALAPDFARHLAPGGHLVLSGLLTHQAPGVIAACRSVGLVLQRRIPVEEWTTLIFTRHQSG